MQCNANQTMAMNPFAHIKFDMCSIWRLVFSSLIIPGTGSVRLCRRMHVRCECLSMVAATLCALDSVCMWVCGINQNRQSQFRVQHSAAVLFMYSAIVLFCSWLLLSHSAVSIAPLWTNIRHTQNNDTQQCSMFVPVACQHIRLRPANDSQRQSTVQFPSFATAIVCRRTYVEQPQPIK